MTRYISTDGEVAFVWSSVVDAPVTGWAPLAEMIEMYPEYKVQSIDRDLLVNRAGPNEGRVKTVKQLMRIYGRERDNG